MSLTLYNGDCLEVMKDLSANSVDLIICDLPYGCLTGGGITKKETAEKYGRKGTEGISGCAWDVKIDLEAFWEQVKRIRRNEHTPCIHFCTTKFGIDLINSNPSEFRYDLVWDKQRGVSFLSANKMPMRSHEMVYVFSKSGAYYNRIDVEKRCPLSVLTASALKKGIHPTEKPLELYKFLIERYCPPGGTVLDPTFGSCNSGRAAEALGRHYIGIEKDKGFFDTAVKNLIPE